MTVIVTYTTLTQPFNLCIPVHATGLFLYTPLKTSEDLWFSDVIRDIERDKLHEKF